MEESVEKNEQVIIEGTISCKKFFEALHKDLGFFDFILTVVANMDYASYLARSALEDKEPIYKNPNELVADEPGKMTKTLRKYRQEILEMFFCRVIDNFQNYLVDVITEILKVKPYILSSKEPTISMEQILNKGSIEELLQEIIESKVNSLSYKGFKTINEWCKKKGIPLEVSDKLDIMVEFIALRNIIVHNRTIIDKKFISTVKRTDLKIGEKFKITTDYFFEAIKVINQVVIRTDRKILEKFNLEKYTIQLFN
jgi:uncharacterized protein YutE (UPF0331/DUF86 family)